MVFLYFILNIESTCIFYYLASVQTFLYNIVHYFVRSGGSDVVKAYLTLTPENLTKNCLKNTPHVVLRNRPTLSMATERLVYTTPGACSWGPSPSTR